MKESETMKTETATKARINFGKILGDSLIEPVVIEKSGRNVAVLISFEEYQRMLAFEDRYWIEKTKEAQQEGFIGLERSEELMQELLNVKD